MNKYKYLIIVLFTLLIESTVHTNTTTTTTAIPYNTTKNENVATTITNLEVNSTIVDNIKNNKTNNLNQDVNIRLPQISTLDKFQISGRTFTFPLNDNFEEYYDLYKKNFSSEDEKNITSPGYPETYPNPIKLNYSISVESGTGIELIIHLLDINPIKDYLKITLIPSTNNDDNDPIIISTNPIILTGYLKKPTMLRAIKCNKILIEFEALEHNSNENKIYKGFVLTYKSFGEKLPPPTIPPDITIPFDKLETSNAFIIVDRLEQNNATWIKMKNLLCNATNQYLNNTLLNYDFELCYPENITFTIITHCPQNWPNSVNCIELNFAIQLYETYDSITTIDPFLTERLPREPGGLNKTLLNNMWNEYGQSIFDMAGYKKYVRVKANDQLLLWLSIGVGILLVIFIIAVTVLKSGVIKNKWVALDEDEKKEYKNHNDIDITMYPSPDQVVPELFPTHTNVYGNEIGYNIDNGRIPSIPETRISREIESSQMIDQGINPAYIEDDDERYGSSFRMRINGVNRDEVNT